MPKNLPALIVDPEFLLKVKFIGIKGRVVTFQYGTDRHSIDIRELTIQDVANKMNAALPVKVTVRPEARKELAIYLLACDMEIEPSRPLTWHVVIPDEFESDKVKTYYVLDLDSPESLLLGDGLIRSMLP